MKNLIESLRAEVINFCNTINEAEGFIKVLTKDEIEDDKLDMEEVILDTEPDIDRDKVKLVDIINKAINGEATLDDIIKVSMKYQEGKKEEGK